MGTLEELLFYLHSHSGIQWIKMSYKQSLVYEGISSSKELEEYLEKKVIKVLYESRSKTLIVVGDELP